MKLSEIHPCDNCGGKLGPVFYVLRFSSAVVNAREANEVLGLTQYFGGALGLAEVMAPRDEVVHVAMDDDDPEIRSLMIEAIICNDCYTSKLVLGLVAEKVRARQEHKDDPPIGAGL